MINKALVVRNRMVDYVRGERAVLDALAGGGGVARLFFTFQDEGARRAWAPPPRVGVWWG